MSACDCQSIDLFTGDFKSQATSLTFTMCDGDVPTKVAADTVGTYLINTIYNDASGNPPSAGCYSVCYDTNGVRSIVNTATQAELDILRTQLDNNYNEWELANYELVVGSDSLLTGGNGSAPQLDLLSSDITYSIFSPIPPTATHAVVNIVCHGFGNDQSFNILDENGKVVYKNSIDTGNDGDSSSDSSRFKLPLGYNGTLNNIFFGIVGSERCTVELAGFAKLNVI